VACFKAAVAGAVYLLVGAMVPWLIEHPSLYYGGFIVVSGAFII
jgi:hypothetical protein